MRSELIFPTVSGTPSATPGTAVRGVVLRGGGLQAHHLPVTVGIDTDGMHRVDTSETLATRPPLENSQNQGVCSDERVLPGAGRWVRKVSTWASRSLATLQTCDLKKPRDTQRPEQLLHTAGRDPEEVGSGDDRVSALSARQRRWRSQLGK